MPRTASQDPYRKFRFVIKFGGEPVAGMTKMSALTASVESTDHRYSDDDAFKRKLPGQTSYEAITFEQGVTDNTAFQDWATAMANYVAAAGSDAEKQDDFRKDITVEIKDLFGNIIKTYQIMECWVSKYTAVPELDADSSDAMIQTLEVQNEGWKVV